jgi:hypothetical protein
MGSEEPSGDEAIPAKKLRDGTSDAARRDELLRYLQRTAGTEGPRRDLIFLESVGSVFGIPPDLAELVETDAVDDRAQAISARVGGTDEDTRVGVARFLVSAHRNLVGVEALNVLSVTLMLVEEELVDPANVPELATGLLNLPLQTPLRVSLLPTAFRAGFRSSTEAGAILCRSVLGDDRLKDEANVEVSHAVIEEAALAAGQFADELGGLIVHQPPGFVRSLIDADLIEDQTWQALMSVRALDVLGDSWRESDEAHSQGQDLDGLVEVCNRVEAHELAYALLARTRLAERSDLAEAWLEANESKALTSTQAVELLQALRLVDRLSWVKAADLLTGAPRVDSVHLYSAFAVLPADLTSQGSWDDVNTSLWESLQHVWGRPQWPSNWEDVSHLGWRSDSWGTPLRALKHELLRAVALVDEPKKPGWFTALATDYLDAIQQASALPAEQQLELMRESAEVWPSLDVSDKASLTQILTSDTSPLTAEGASCWIAHLSRHPDGPEFPLEDDAVLELIVSSNVFELGVVRLWLRHRVSSSELLDRFLAGLQENSVELKSFRHSLAEGLKRLGSEAAARCLCTILERDLSLNGEDVEVLTGLPLDEATVSECLAEYLRDAANDEQRERGLKLWGELRPSDDIARRKLIQALTVMAEGGKGALRKVLRNIDLAQDPPKGVKTRLVETIRRRARELGLRRDADSALKEVGLIRVKKSGLFGLRRTTEIEPDNDEA